MALAGIELRYLVNDISGRTEDYYLSNIYGITKIEQIEPNKLLRRLRDDLTRFKLKEIKQIGTERIAYLTFSHSDKEFVIVGEFFGDGNIILCNSEMKILALLYSVNVRHRQLRVGSQYVPPPQGNLDVLNMTEKDFGEIRFTSTPVAKWIGRTLGLPRKYAEEITRLANVESKKMGEEISNDEVKKLFDVATQIGLDTVFTENIVSKGKSIQSSSFDKKISELETRLEEQTKAIKTVTEKSENIAKVASSFSEYMSQGISNMDDSRINNLLKTNNAEIIKEKGIDYIKVDDAKIKVNLGSSLPTTASVLFNASKKQKAAIIPLQKLVKKTEKELEKVIDKGEVAKQAVSFSEIRKKNWFERYRWFYTSDGILAVGGRDSSSNSAIIRKRLEKNDKVFHTEISGSPFFLLKDDISPTSASLTEVAHATVCFSRAWKESIYGSSAYWVNPDQVKKAAPSGQSMGKGSFAIEGQRNFVKISTLKLCVAIIKQEENYLLTCGPPSLQDRCVCYAMIEPGSMEMVDVAKKIRVQFITINEEIAKSFSVDDYVRVLPSGLSHMIDSGS